MASFIGVSLASCRLPRDSPQLRVAKKISVPN
jgi:hypothetical protein